MTASKRVAALSARRSKPTLNGWERYIFKEVLQRQRAADAVPFVRFNFLVHDGRVFFIDTLGWWHSLPGEARKIATALRKAGIRITRVKIIRSGAPWTPYFGRTRDEEPNRGWNDPTIELKPVIQARTAILRRTWDLYRAQKQSKRPVSMQGARA
jgi:hypothetical protein